MSSISIQSDGKQWNPFDLDPNALESEVSASLIGKNIYDLQTLGSESFQLFSEESNSATIRCSQSLPIKPNLILDFVVEYKDLKVWASISQSFKW